ncbi:hypothetical protein BP6252_09543 [Coleophoma cylindrospora]|uniref:Extracellular serine-rich protein n=1 Tax=Coleophoma cylindrospora TaxID=1849047 RepID=A0A3D8R292_9HELO|nr:hypothetical protein BP6252_09543 [Coleophoma cylindrospora]
MVNAANIINGILAFLGAGQTSNNKATTSTTSQAKTSTTKAVAATSSAVGVSSAFSSIISSASSSAASSAASVAASSISSLSLFSNIAVASETVGVANVGASVAVAPVATKAVVINGSMVNTNTSTAVNVTIPLNVTVNIATSVSSTILIIARDNSSAYSAYSGLNGYRIPFQILAVPQTGVPLPTLNSSATAGNFGAIVVLSEVSYDYGTSFASALTSDQWAALYAYQIAFGVRMVRLDVYPGPSSGTEAQGGCCAAGQEQTISISNGTGFPTAGLNTGATLSTLGLYHYPATITDPTIAWEFAQFGASTGFASPSTAGVINNILGREQMVFFTSFATDWSETSNFLQHAWIHWATRGLYAGFRRVYFVTQVDDMFLGSNIYYPANNTFRIRTGDLDLVKSWMATLNTKLNPGSKYFMEIGHNGNGNIEQATALDTTASGKLCGKGPVEYDDQIDTPLEFQKPLGTGASIWEPPTAQYAYSAACTKNDPLLVWWTTQANRDVFAHVSHTFTHEGQNNATFSDINYEISWNQAWLKQVGLDQALHFSSKGLIPPAITGLHNGDALRAWASNGITNCVGDNTRPPLLNAQNEHWPLITNVANNGYDGMQVTPRWATTIYYNCDTANCTVNEWIVTSAGQGDIYTLLNNERQSTGRHLMGLRHDGYMFHQANLRAMDVDPITINGVTSKLSLISTWVEVVVQEMVRLVNWPMISLKHDDLSQTFADRMAADACNMQMAYVTDPLSRTITGVTLTCNSNTCSVPLPITFPASVTDTKGFTTEKVGNDPLTIWVKMTGSPVTFTLSAPIPW